MNIPDVLAGLSAGVFASFRFFASIIGAICTFAYTIMRDKGKSISYFQGIMLLLCCLSLLGDAKGQFEYIKWVSNSPSGLVAMIVCSALCIISIFHILKDLRRRDK